MKRPSAQGAKYWLEDGYTPELAEQIFAIGDANRDGKVDFAGALPYQ